jgi:hypothetical protein
MLGHASAAMTLDVCTDLFDDDLDAVAAALDQAKRSAMDVTVLSRERDRKARMARERVRSRSEASHARSRP